MDLSIFANKRVTPPSTSRAWETSCTTVSLRTLKQKPNLSVYADRRSLPACHGHLICLPITGLLYYFYIILNSFTFINLFQFLDGLPYSYALISKASNFFTYYTTQKHLHTSRFGTSRNFNTLSFLAITWTNFSNTIMFNISLHQLIVIKNGVT